MSEVCKYIHDNLKKLWNNVTEKYLIIQILNFPTSNIFIIDCFLKKAIKQCKCIYELHEFLKSSVASSFKTFILSSLILRKF